MPKAHAGGQPAGGRPSTPDFNRLEDLAVARAALAASLKPNQQSAELTKRTAELYPLKLEDVTKTYPWVDKKYGRANDTWTQEKSSSLRPQGTSLWDRWMKRLLPACRNHLSPALAKWYNADGTVPSGQTLEDAEEFVLDAWYKHKTKEVVDLEGSPASSQVDAVVLAKRLIHEGKVTSFDSISVSDEGLHDMVKDLFKTPSSQGQPSLDPSMFVWTQPEAMDKMLTEKSDPEKMAKLAFTFHSVGDRITDEDQKETFIYKICQRCFVLVSAAVDDAHKQAEEQAHHGPSDGDIPVSGKEGGLGGLHGKKRQKKSKSNTRPSDWDPGNIYFVWKILGPLGEKAAILNIPGPKLEKTDEDSETPPPPPNRQQQRQQAEQEREMKRNKERESRKADKQAAIDELIRCEKLALENDEFTIPLTQWSQKRFALKDEYEFAKDMGDVSEMERLRELSKQHHDARPTRPTRPTPGAAAAPPATAAPE